MENENKELESNSSDSDQFPEENGTFSQWLQDNARIIISIVIVIAIAVGIYSYSNRTPSAMPGADEITRENTKLDETTKPDETSPQEKNNPAAPQEKKLSPKGPESQETEISFIETAGRGDGTTHLARRALANYLEKNPDASLTPEHKIYIEDYLRKHVSAKHVAIGSTTEFSKDLIRTAIERSKNLSEGQIRNLHKFAIRVPSLS